MRLKSVRASLVLLLAACLLLAPSLAQAAPLAAAAPKPVSTSSVTVNVDNSAQRIDATYSTADDLLAYQGQFFSNAQGAPESFTASVGSQKSGTFAEGSFAKDHFWIRLGAVEIDSASPITEEQAEMIAAFAATEDATELRKMVQALYLEASAEKRYLLALTAMVMVVDAGAGAPAQAADDCFGCCGPGCWGCTGCYTKACRAHDQCVKDHGHLHCLLGLIPAIWSLIAECLLNLNWWLA